ncbi:hypothetical protein PtrSN002B_002365 [Pyrenophora tritici-repentis]|uniref:Uncharacterized protein n=2 Tax=Pyrenophora tritici-repentis TaxID=45151 RepID=A0A2W1G7W9_9PLEO|nr:uncharacterized protein PTRG_09356 [Pyrenophora tritici-repentis Pt-1C-BFP]KAA8617503.1 hypothetical protein PtrV1_09010 [Pyrenophora tritici-repentis]EDU42407.1 hypothetical protein PTRG_09356 [Pyrenophora tritici-repentis Pt-1C-BFP]KAF7441941.1 hypothetical protein A1F99_137930 [Pyrenophora tritici-repentis]KAF7567953.1 hypothetical protein PtrM4_125660 [Pyrenophora tritici-repentis]KAG9376771.1 hypothetical protein A1F94_012371 [Pyrenophora tritici-repentis]
MRFFIFATVLSAGFATAVPMLSEQHSDSTLITERKIAISPAKDDPAVLATTPSGLNGKRDPEPVTAGAVGARATEVSSVQPALVAQRGFGEITLGKDDPEGLRVSPGRPGNGKRVPEPAPSAIVPVRASAIASGSQPTQVSREITDVNPAKDDPVGL